MTSFTRQVLLLFALSIVLIACQQKKTFTLPKADADNGGLILPDGFGALVVVDSLGLTRHLAVNDNGDIYVKMRIIDRDSGTVALRDTNDDGRADIIQRFGDYENDGSFATEMRIHNGYIYFSSELRVYRQKLTPPNLIPDGHSEIVVIDPYPLRWHNAKSLAFDNKGAMYVTFSAPTNVCEDWSSVSGKSTEFVKGQYPCEQLKAFGGIWQFDANKLQQSQSDGRLYATGLRSVVAIAWNEADSGLYAVQHGRDYLSGHDPLHFTEWENAVLPAEEFVKIKNDSDFGWPYTYYDPFKHKRMIAPEYGGDGEKEATGYEDPLMGLPAHWAPNDLLFYKGDQFPARYKKGAFIAFHGSTNRAPYPQGGYIVAFVPFENGKPTDHWEVFADGFAGVDTIASMADAKYRPMGLSEGPDGSLYVSESKKGKIWRVLFTGDRTNFGNAQLAAMEKRKSRSYLKIPDEKADRLTVK
ncbi:PQQ-dependent sugar dehydrogenase [Chryseolinea lacunae]|uniref:PQQ-dependent sugar dehydrogenase n=1 Tax=Chryseolinea lacunae TaxID=2801331 RepID=A0ABS1KWB0_9BACT|nr:PQQ-dependent sugar dehydrogenase [Chryseolinea lacunae]MBL0742972.1 PQQ-dependent sugar dehydrogenase [Chryseolinea lacunae]